LTVGVIILGVLSFGLGVLPYAQASVTGQLPATNSENFFDNIGLGVGLIGLALLLAAALVAAFGMLPQQPGTEAVVAGLAVAGFVSLVFLLLGLVDTSRRASADPGTGVLGAAGRRPSDRCCCRRARQVGLVGPSEVNARVRSAAARGRRRPTRLPGAVPAYGRPPSVPAGTTTQPTANTPNQ
jgi:hypothetical protein